MVINNGIPPENVIHLSLDDITWDDWNPLKGKLFAHKNGPDVRKDCQIDYYGENEDTKQNWFNVMKGDSEAAGGKKVLKSTKDSKVFVYYIDHGNRGIVAMPDETVYADELQEVLKYMHDHDMYNELVFYMTACHGGSMFHNLLPEDTKIIAMTSASPDESSYMNSCPPWDDVAENKHMGVCLGDQVSDIWAKEAEKNSRSVTIRENIEKTQKKIKDSIVSRYGDTSFWDKPLANYAGKYEKSETKTLRSLFESSYINEVEEQNKGGEHIKASDLKLAHLYANVMSNSGGHKAQIDLMEELNMRVKVDHIFKHFDYMVGNSAEESTDDINFDCMRTMVNAYKEKCDQFGEYTMTHVDSFIKACNKEIAEEDLVKALVEECH